MLQIGVVARKEQNLVRDFNRHLCATIESIGSRTTQVSMDF